MRKFKILTCTILVFALIFFIIMHGNFQHKISLLKLKSNSCGYSVPFSQKHGEYSKYAVNKNYAGMCFSKQENNLPFIINTLWTGTIKIIGWSTSTNFSWAFLEKASSNIDLKIGEGSAETTTSKLYIKKNQSGSAGEVINFSCKKWSSARCLTWNCSWFVLRWNQICFVFILCPYRNEIPI